MRKPHTQITSVFGGARCLHVTCGSARNSTVKIIWSGSTASEKGKDAHSMSVSDGLAWSGSGRGATSTSVNSPARPCGWIWPWPVSPDRN